MQGSGWEIQHLPVVRWMRQAPGPGVGRLSVKGLRVKESEAARATHLYQDKLLPFDESSRRWHVNRWACAAVSQNWKSRWHGFWACGLATGGPPTWKQSLRKQGVERGG